MDLVVTNNDLAKKFRQAAVKKTTITDFTNEFLSQFLSPETKIAYLKDLRFFFDFLKSGNAVINQPSDIKTFHFQLYRDHLAERKLAAATINRRLVCIRSFVKWSVASKLMEYNPLDAIKLPKVQTETPTVAFDDTEVVDMINAPDITTHRGRTAKLAMVLLFNLGLRRSELSHIKLSDIVEDRGHTVLNITGKGNKVRRIPLSSNVASEIALYVNQLNLTKTEYMLQTEELSRNTKPIDGSTIYRIISKYVKQVGINKQLSPHSCRATVISHLLDTKNASIRDVATFVGHVNITTTELYDKRRQNLDKSAAYAVNYGA